MSFEYYEYDNGKVERLRNRIAELEGLLVNIRHFAEAAEARIDGLKAEVEWHRQFVSELVPRQRRLEAAEARIAELEAALELNAAFGVALNYFLLRDPDKPTSWMYSRNKAEELARAALGGQDND